MDSSRMTVLSPHIPIFPPNEPDDSQIEGGEGGEEKRMGKVNLPALIGDERAKITRESGYAHISFL